MLDSGGSTGISRERTVSRAFSPDGVFIFKRTSIVPFTFVSSTPPPLPSLAFSLRSDLFVLQNRERFIARKLMRLFKRRSFHRFFPLLPLFPLFLFLSFLRQAFSLFSRRFPPKRESRPRSYPETNNYSSSLASLVIRRPSGVSFVHTAL